MAKILVACEESQAVTKELRLLGHEAYSCDLLPESGGHPEWHLEQDVVPLLKQDWDMIIAFPPCHDLAVSGARYFKEKQADGRQQASIDFFMEFANAQCERVAIENPVGIMSTHWRKPDQIIEPYQFGDPVKKKTCLWLKNLPKLVATDIVEPEANIPYGEGRSHQRWISNAPVKNRRVIRSKTWPGIAKAMAHQWGTILV